MNANKILYITAASIFVLLASLTIIFFAAGKAVPGKDLVTDSQSALSNQSDFTSTWQPPKKTYTKLGQLRTSSKPDSKGKYSVIIITPYLEYTADDKDFYEELDKKQSQIKKIIVNYISSKTTEELNKKGEIKITAELLSQINAVLVLQKIQQIYFSDFQYL